MYCPSCRSEYKPGFTRCDDCDTDLVYELPLPEPVGDPHAPGMVKVLSSFNQAEVMLARALLEGEDIVHHVQGELFSGSGVYITPVNLFVPEGEADRIRDMLRDHGLFGDQEEK